MWDTNCDIIADYETLQKLMHPIKCNVLYRRNVIWKKKKKSPIQYIHLRDIIRHCFSRDLIKNRFYSVMWIAYTLSLLVPVYWQQLVHNTLRTKTVRIWPMKKLHGKLNIIHVNSNTDGAQNTANLWQEKFYIWYQVEIIFFSFFFYKGSYNSE